MTTPRPSNRYHAHQVTPRAAVLTAVAAVPLILGGCATSTHHSATSMMGGSGYHYKPLTCSAPTSLPGTTVNVQETDMGMSQMMNGTAPRDAHMMLQTTPATAPAGQISIVVSNRGWRTHELVILPLTAYAAPGRRVAGADGKVIETDSLGEASASCAHGAGHGITAGAVAWTTVTLTAGHYELLCNLANHYTDGMHEELTVT